MRQRLKIRHIIPCFTVSTLQHRTRSRSIEEIINFSAQTPHHPMLCHATLRLQNSNTCQLQMGPQNDSPRVVGIDLVCQRKYLSSGWTAPQDSVLFFAFLPLSCGARRDKKEILKIEEYQGHDRILARFATNAYESAFPAKLYSAIIC